MFRFVILLGFLCAPFGTNGNEQTSTSPPHCTTITKETDYGYHFKLNYPVAYLQPGQREGYQAMYCVNPAEVNKAVATVCDWAAPPQVMFTIGDEYVHVVRQDPTQRFLGNAIITTYQQCNHTSTIQNVNIPDENKNMCVVEKVRNC